MRKFIINVSVIFFLIGTKDTKAQSTANGWLASFYTIKTGKKTGIISDIQLRSTDEWKHTQALLLRAGLNYKSGKNTTLTAGYAYIHSRRQNGTVTGYAHEHRLWEQLLYQHKLNRLQVAHRFRLEQRFVAKTKVVSGMLETNGTDYSNRFRYFIRNILPLQQTASFTKGPFLALQNEVFLNVGNNSNVNGKAFDQNRLYLAAGYRLRKEADLEMGYMNQYISRRGSQFTNAHIFQLALYLRL